MELAIYHRAGYALEIRLYARNSIAQILARPPGIHFTYARLLIAVIGSATTSNVISGC